MQGGTYAQNVYSGSSDMKPIKGAIHITVHRFKSPRHQAIDTIAYPDDEKHVLITPPESEGWYGS
jgi:hypothetical protein